MTNFVTLLQQAEEHVLEAQRCLDQIKEPLQQAENLALVINELNPSIKKERRHFFMTILSLQAAVIGEHNRKIAVTGYTITWCPERYYLQCAKEESRGFVNCHPELFECGSQYQPVFWEYCEKLVAQIETVLEASPYLREAEKLKELTGKLTAPLP